MMVGTSSGRSDCLTSVVGRTHGLGSRMLQTCSTLTIDVPAEVVWRVVTDVDAYAEWNAFTVGCRTTWEVGTPIVMKVRLRPRLTIRQRETIRVHEHGRLIEYGIDLPLGMLRSSRRHVLTAVGAGTSRYDSEFVLEGRLAPGVHRLLGEGLRQGFDDMTAGIARRCAASSMRDRVRTRCRRGEATRRSRRRSQTPETGTSVCSLTGRTRSRSRRCRSGARARRRRRPTWDQRGPR